MTDLAAEKIPYSTGAGISMMAVHPQMLQWSISYQPRASLWVPAPHLYRVLKEQIIPAPTRERIRL